MLYTVTGCGLKQVMTRLGQWGGKGEASGIWRLSKSYRGQLIRSEPHSKSFLGRRCSLPLGQFKRLFNEAVLLVYSKCSGLSLLNPSSPRSKAQTSLGGGETCLATLSLLSRSLAPLTLHSINSLAFTRSPLTPPPSHHFPSKYTCHQTLP
jgi:hypothetical protein